MKTDYLSAICFFLRILTTRQRQLILSHIKLSYLNRRSGPRVFLSGAYAIGFFQDTNFGTSGFFWDPNPGTSGFFRINGNPEIPGV